MRISTYLADLTKVLGVGAGFASIPLFAALASLEPPWPPAIGIVSAAVVVIGALIVWEYTRRSKIRYRRTWILASTASMWIGLVTYFVMYSLFVEVLPGTQQRLVRGFTCTTDALQVYGNACPDLPSAALEDAGWNQFELWTRSSITLARVGLALSWMVFTVGLIMAAGAIVAGRKV